LAVGAGILLPLVVFVPVAAQAHMRETSSWDAALSRWLYRYSAHGTFLSRGTDVLEGVITHRAQLIGMFALAVLVCVLALRRMFRSVLLIAAAVAGTLVLEPVLKELVGRRGPDPYGKGYSFPSGHAMRSMAAAAAVTASAWTSVWRWPAAAVGAIAAGLVGVGVVFDGWHWASDVIGAWCVSIAWVTALVLALRPERDRRTSAPASALCQSVRQPGLEEADGLLKPLLEPDARFVAE
jgi:undecaprenyl-diphosphatase